MRIVGMTIAEARDLLHLQDVDSSVEQINAQFQYLVKSAGPDTDVTELKLARDICRDEAKRREKTDECKKCGGRGYVGRPGASVKCSCKR